MARLPVYLRILYDLAADRVASVSSERLAELAGVNAAKVVFTGRKRDQKMYYHHTGFIGGIKERSAKSIFEGRFPERIVEKAVERMLPRGPLGRRQLGNLRVYPGAEHPHEAQKPEALDVGALNRKNKAA